MDEHRKNIIISQCCEGFTDKYIEKFLYMVEKTGLDPIARQIYGIVRNVKKKDKYGKEVWEKVLTVQTSIDGFRLIAERTKLYAPGKETVYTYKKDGSLHSATAYIKKMTADGTWHEVSGYAVFDEYYAKGSFWDRMPTVMLSKCSEALALRKSFAQELSGLYTDDEMAQATEEAIKEEEKVETLTPYQKIAKHFDVPCDVYLTDFVDEVRTSTHFKEDELVNFFMTLDCFVETFTKWKFDRDEDFLEEVFGFFVLEDANERNLMTSYINTILEKSPIYLGKLVENIRANKERFIDSFNKFKVKSKL